MSQLAGTVEYTDCISAEELDPPNECRRYDTQEFDVVFPVMLELWGMQITPSLPLFPGSL